MFSVEFQTRTTRRVDGADTLLLLSFCAKTLSPTLIESSTQIWEKCGESPMAKEAQLFLNYGGRVMLVNLWGGLFTARPSAAYPIINRKVELPDSQIRNVIVTVGGTPQVLNTHYTVDLERGVILFFPNLPSNATQATITYEYPNYNTPVFPLTVIPNTKIDSVFCSELVEMSIATRELLLGYAADLRAFVFAGVNALSATEAWQGRYDPAKWWFAKSPRLVLTYPQKLTNLAGKPESSALHLLGALSRNKYLNKWNSIEGLSIPDVSLGSIEYSINFPEFGVTTFTQPLNQPVRSVGAYTSAYTGDETNPLRFFASLQSQDEIWAIAQDVSQRYNGLPYTEDYIALIASILDSQISALGGLTDVSVEFDRANMVNTPNQRVILPFIIKYRQIVSVELFKYTAILEL